MCAASVNPEPGSNSRNHGIQTDLRRIKSIPSFDCSLPFLELCSLSELRDFLSHFQCFILFSCCSIFKDRLRRSCGDFSSIPHCFAFCQGVFATFFDFFRFALRYFAPLIEAHISYHRRSKMSSICFKFPQF